MSRVRSTVVRAGAISALAVATLAGAVAAGTTPAHAAGSSSQHSARPAHRLMGTKLVVSYHNPGVQHSVWVLTCDPASGTHPHPAAACDALAEHSKALKPVSPDQLCTMIYSGPQTAQITGIVKGRFVNAWLSRTDGCQTARWQALEGLVPAL